MTEKEYVLQNRKHNIYIEAAAVMIFFIAAAYFQGLYFPNRYLPANALLIVYMLYILNKRGRRLFLNAAVFPLFCFSCIYFLSVLYGVNREGAVYEVLRISAYLPAFIIGLLSYEFQRKYIDGAVILSGVIVSIIGLLNLSGLLNMDGTLYGGRIQSTFQYANVTAVYLMIGVILGMKLAGSWELGAGGLSVRIYQFGNIAANMCIYVLVCGLILTYSRGVWIVFVIFNLYAIMSRQLLQKSTKIRYLYILMISGTASVFLASLTGKGWFMVVLLIGAGISMLPEMFSFPPRSSLSTHHLYPNAIRLLSAIGLAAASMLHSTIFIRLSNISFNATEWTARLAYYKGALKLIRDYPLFGSGAMGWEVLSERYAGDYVKYVHNYYLHILTDVGLVGFMFFLIFIMTIFKRYMKCKKKDIYPALIAATILMHSLVDIDMHFQLIAIIFFFYCGVAAQVNGE
ncbi:MAG: O-antigen ligase family protein [Clostridia bacterium]